ncbi:hypothetical protein Tco_1147291 [Tanacetum coccineum]
MDEEMFDANVLDGEEVFVAEQEVVVKDVNNEVNVVEEVVEVINSAKLITDVTQVSTAGNVVSTAGDANNERSCYTKRLGESSTNNIFQLSLQQSRDKGKGILIELIKPMKKKDLIRLDEEAALKLQAEFDKEERLAREKVEKEKEAIIPD